MRFRLIEPCCGSAALTFHLLGAKRSSVPYQGSKWRLRNAIAEAMMIKEPPSAVELSDIGPWGITAAALLDPVIRECVMVELEEMSEADPYLIYEQTNKSRADPSNIVMYAAQHLFLQRLAFSGKAVTDKSGFWSSPGFNKTSAYGKQATDKFGEIRPMVPSMIEAIKSYDTLLHPGQIIGSKKCATASPYQSYFSGKTIVYIDPPYRSTTGYSTKFGRESVVNLAKSWSEKGASVYVSESEPIKELCWPSVCLTKKKSDGSPFKGKHSEWLTFFQN